MKERRAEIVVSKNSGGAATYGKIEAARLLRLPVVMIERPDKPALHTVSGRGAKRCAGSKRCKLKRRRNPSPNPLPMGEGVGRAR